MVKEQSNGHKTSPSPLNQGRQGTCVSNAVTQIVVGMMKTKYGVPLNENEVLTIMKDRVGKLDGTNEKTVCKCWNENPPAIEDIEKSFAYKFKIYAKPVQCFKEACEAIGKLRGTCSASIEYDRGGHAVAAYDVLKKSIRAVNSWGVSEPYIDISEKRFIKAWVIEVNIIHKERDGVMKGLPETTQYFNSLKTGPTVETVQKDLQAANWQKYLLKIRMEAKLASALAKLQKAKAKLQGRLEVGEEVRLSRSLMVKPKLVKGTAGYIKKVHDDGSVSVQFTERRVRISAGDLEVVLSEEEDENGPEEEAEEDGDCHVG